MPDDAWIQPPFSPQATHVFALLLRRGGCMRIGPLIAASGLPAAALAAALNELAERCWIKITWRSPQARRPDTLPENFRDVRHLTTTALGRWRYLVTW